MTDTDKSSFSRRWLCASALAVSCLPHAAVKATEFWDEIWDVIVVGSGYAGLAAAIEAKRAGARVLVIEKMQSPGGNSVLSTGDMAVADSPVQHALGIFDDSPERMAEDLLRLGKINDPIRCRIVSFGSLETWQWTRTELGVHWIADALQWDEGQSIARGCMVASRSGLEIVSAELNQLKKWEEGRFSGLVKSGKVGHDNHSYKEFCHGFAPPPLSQRIQNQCCSPCPG